MAKIAEEYRADIAWHTKRADMFRKDAAAAIGVRHDWYMKRANEEEMAAIIIGQNLADMLAKSERTADSKTDKPNKSEKKVPPPDINNCIRYVREQKRLIEKGDRPKASKKSLIAEHLEPLGISDTSAMEKSLQPKRYGWLLEAGQKTDK